MSSELSSQNGHWNEIKIGDNVYMFSVSKKDDTFTVFLTNLIELWMEILTQDAILNKCRELNRLLHDTSLNCTDIVSNILNSIEKHIVQATVEEIQLRAEIENNQFKFALNLRKASPEEFWKIITKPLCLSSIEILRQHRILLGVVKKKDAEIAEYKAEGAELIRKNIETKPFDESQLKLNASLNTTDCVGAFRAMVDIYNSLESLKNQAKLASTSTSSICNAENGTGSVSSQSPKTQRKSPRSGKKQQSKYNSSKLVSNSDKYMSIVPTRSKTKKKGLNDFI